MWWDDSGKQIGIVDSAVWNKIFQARINWDAMKICHTYDASYHRCGQLDLEFTGVRDYDSRLDELKRAVFDPKYKYISFDVFDTVVQRPFYDPQDLFDLLDIEYEKKCKNQYQLCKNQETCRGRFAPEDHGDDRGYYN